MAKPRLALGLTSVGTRVSFWMVFECLECMPFLQQIQQINSTQKRGSPPCKHTKKLHTTTILDFQQLWRVLILTTWNIIRLFYADVFLESEPRWAPSTLNPRDCRHFRSLQQPKRSLVSRPALKTKHTFAMHANTSSTVVMELTSREALRWLCDWQPALVCSIFMCNYVLM